VTPEFQYQLDNSSPTARKKQIQGMFDDIVPTYDLLNRLLSMGIDKTWRRKLIKLSGDFRG
jgi:demethylmenaquinone methyltransferase/2-methoxy-6-polyprenyl-1,4-benzoquinol methylase